MFIKVSYITIKILKLKKVKKVKLEFRELFLEDLDIIKKLSKSMDMRNDPKIGDTAEALIKDPKCFLYGAFEGSQLVGVGGLREKFENFPWIEDIRVHGKYQKKGVGTALFSYGEKLTRKRGYPRVAFQTVTENAGSCRIGEKLGYERRHEMVALWMRSKEAPSIVKEFLKQEAVPIEIALEKFFRIPNAPKDEICIGWSYSPLEVGYFKSEPDMDFYFAGNTALLDFRDRNISTNEIAIAKAIIYGSKDNVKELVYGFMGRNKELGVPLICLCPEELVPEILNIGFEYATVWTGGHNIVVLFNKKLHS